VNAPSVLWFDRGFEDRTVYCTGLRDAARVVPESVHKRAAPTDPMVAVPATRLAARNLPFISAPAQRQGRSLADKRAWRADQVNGHTFQYSQHCEDYASRSGGHRSLGLRAVLVLESYCGNQVQTHKSRG
jgi:hypothetical protein